MRVMVLGAAGMLGQAVVHVLDNYLVSLSTNRVSILTQDMNPFNRVYHAIYSLLDTEKLVQEVGKYRPDVIINCAAYTKVDKAEEEPEQAKAINGHMPARLADLCRVLKIRLIHISTDYVFDGEKGNYIETDETHPLNVYGASKLLGELGIIESKLSDYIIIRTAGLYGHGGINFVDTLLSKYDAGQREFKVVNDQITNVTNTFSLAQSIRLLLERPDMKGIYHITDDQKTTWYDLAIRVFKIVGYAKHQNVKVNVLPISAKQYGAKAIRPVDSSLNLTKWKTEALKIPSIVISNQKILEAHIIDRYSIRWGYKLLW